MLFCCSAMSCCSMEAVAKYAGPDVTLDYPEPAEVSAERINSEKGVRRVWALFAAEAKKECQQVATAKRR